jgi:hypothetical protein
MGWADAFGNAFSNSQPPHHHGPPRSYSIAIKRSANTPKPRCGWSALAGRDPLCSCLYQPNLTPGQMEGLREAELLPNGFA